MSIQNLTPTQHIGRYRANVDFAQLQDNDGKPVLYLELELNEIYHENQWKPMRTYTGSKSWSYLIKKDGEVNTVAVKQIASAFGWNQQKGPLLEWLSDPENTGIAIQCQIKEEMYNDQKQYKVAWLYHYDDPVTAPGAIAATPDKIKSFDNAFAGKFAAVQIEPRAETADDFPY